MIAYFKYTSGSTFTLSGEAYKGFFFVDGGVAYAGKDTSITSQPLSSTNTFRADSYLNQFEFDRTVSDVSANHTLEKPDISPRSVLSDVIYQRNLDMLHTNNVKLFGLGVLANSNILDFGSAPSDAVGSGFLGLSSGTTDIRNDDTVLYKNNTRPIHIDPYSMTENVPAVVDLDDIVNGDIVIGDNEDTFYYFVTTSTKNLVLSGSMSRGSSLREVNNFIPNTDKFHYDSVGKKLWTYTYVNDNLTITIYDISLYESCQTAQVYDRQLLTIKGADITTLRTGRRLKGIIADTYASSQIETIYDEVEVTTVSSSTPSVEGTLAGLVADGAVEVAPVYSSTDEAEAPQYDKDSDWGIGPDGEAMTALERRETTGYSGPARNVGEAGFIYADGSPVYSDIGKYKGPPDHPDAPISSSIRFKVERNERREWRVVAGGEAGFIYTDESMTTTHSLDVSSAVRLELSRIADVNLALAKAKASSAYAHAAPRAVRLDLDEDLALKRAAARAAAVNATPEALAAAIHAHAAVEAAARLGPPHEEPVVDPDYDPVTALEDLWTEGSEDIESCIPIVLMYNEVTQSPGDWVARELVVAPSNVSPRNPLGLDESWMRARINSGPPPSGKSRGAEWAAYAEGIRGGIVSPMPEEDWPAVRWKPAETAGAIINKRAEIAGGEYTTQHQAWLRQYTSVDWDAIPPIRLPRWDEGPGPEGTVNQNRAHENFLVLTLHALGYTSTDRLYEGPAVDPVPGQTTVRGPANSEWKLDPLWGREWDKASQEWVLVEGFTGLDSKEKMHQRIVADNLLCIQAFFSQELPESVVVYTEPVAYTKPAKPKGYEGMYSICIYRKDSSEIFKKFTKTEFNDEMILGFDIRTEDDSMIVMTIVSDYYLNMYHIDLSGDGIVPSPTLVRRFRDSGSAYHYPSIENDKFSVSFSADDSNVFTIVDSGFMTTRFISNPEYPSGLLQRSNLMFPPDLLFSDTNEKFGKIQMKFNTNSLKSNYYNFKNIATATIGGNRYILYQNIGRIYFGKTNASTSYHSVTTLDLPHNYTVNTSSCKSSIGLAINTDIQELITDTISILVNSNVKVLAGLVEGIPILSNYVVGDTIEIDPTNFFMYSNENLNYLTVSRMFDQIYSLQETVYNNII